MGAGARTGGSVSRPRSHRYYVVPVKTTDRKFMTASTSVCHTLCPSTAIVIRRIMRTNVAPRNFICALPGDRFRLALTVAATLRNLLIVTAEGAPAQAAAPVEAMFRDAVSGKAKFFGSQVRLMASGGEGPMALLLRHRQHSIKQLLAATRIPLVTYVTDGARVRLRQHHWGEGL